MDDAAQLARVAAGDESAMEELYRRHQSRVFHFALSRLHDEFEAAEVLNEVMMQVWRGAGSFQGRSRVTTWILGIAHHKVIDHLRRRGRVNQQELDPALADEQSPRAGEVAERLDDARHLAYCMSRLSDNHRQVIHLAFFEDLSYPEISRIVDCPEGTVKTRMFHARKLLKRCLVQNFGINGGDAL